MTGHSEPDATPVDPITATDEADAGAGLGGLGWQLGTVAKTARARFEALLARAGGSFTTWKILEVLDVHGPLKQRDLAAAVGIEGPTLTRQLERLDAQNLVTRRRVGGDRRITEIAPTQDGVALHSALRRAAEQANHELADGLSPHEIETLRSTLDRILLNLNPALAHGGLKPRRTVGDGRRKPQSPPE
ncbi:MarR family winged helix-turn-helix transcriptional regulator [Streptosporangium sp. 'caverna']|uniref:MarR family winged helix-turn-helix transcriptional regulator n=1 Tax=Streptosporangium sp. 'caverna' TaxID=2202249 RepID=UPI000D7E5D68|nr:MarR family transcriptional regulator [Streptosporangium sp. 'caverna']AWS43390.1 MarR family transcriptional regulator [Streptosporangium sp. 'caverna']